jgi:serine/threonine protein phosphatase PrpC
MSLKLSAWCKTDKGRKRERNEDGCLVAEPIALYAVADGMGGHRGGAHASKLALEVLQREVELRMAPQSSKVPEEGVDFGGIAFLDTAEIPVVAPEDVLDDGRVSAKGILYLAAQRASDAVFDASRRDPSLRGMGTTLTAMMIEAASAHFVHAGDSRAYRLRGGRLEQISEDHSWTREQVKAGMMTEDQAKASEFRHIITRSIGFERHVRLDSYKVEVEPGDCLLLCSDGMSNYIEHEELERLMAETPASELSERLVELANERGGEDNITVVVVSAEAAPDEATEGAEGYEQGDEDADAAATDSEAAADLDLDAYGDTAENPRRE